MLQNYGSALLEFTPDRLKILPFQGKPEDQVATVRSEVRRDNGSRVPVNYSLRKTPSRVGKPTTCRSKACRT